MRQSIEPLDLFAVLQMAWSRETSSDGKNWSVENKAWGQCAVTALVVQDFFGGELMRADLSGSTYPEIAALRSHYSNHIQISNSAEYRDIDFTKTQFADQDEYSQLVLKATIKPREYLLPKNLSFDQLKFKERYKLLRLKVVELLANNSRIFKDPVYQKCLCFALDSDCQKGKYGCVIINANTKHDVAAFNKQLDPLKG